MSNMKSVLERVVATLKAIRDADIKEFEKELQRLSECRWRNLNIPLLWGTHCADTPLTSERSEMLVRLSSVIPDTSEKWFILALATLGDEKCKDHLLALSTPDILRGVYYVDLVDKLALSYRGEFADLRMQYASLHPSRVYVTALSRYSIGERLLAFDSGYLVYAPLSEVRKTGAQMVWEGQVGEVAIVAGIPLSIRTDVGRLHSTHTNPQHSAIACV